MSTPREILLARAVGHFERAQLELANGNHETAADYIEKGITQLREAITS